MIAKASFEFYTERGLAGLWLLIRFFQSARIIDECHHKTMDIVLSTSLLRRRELEIEKEPRFGNTQNAEQEDYRELEAAMAYL